MFFCHYSLSLKLIDDDHTLAISVKLMYKYVNTLIASHLFHTVSCISESSMWGLAGGQCRSTHCFQL